ncbi:YqeG family HAD IIIA-type phosphatase [Agrilactobacillus fermenti]|uniref:YqeG family HAD IIIA-type phosphatase n=1 Tax=Agrilactobacillus fermenti TaxID=2586909 RepID=UPI003A5C11CB
MSFTPTFMIESIFNIDADQLKQLDIKNILTDLDNTLLPWNDKRATDELKHWLAHLTQAGIKVIVVSNNNHQRVKLALKDIDVPFISRALKPTTKGIRHAIQQFNLRPSETVMVGDQLMTDIFAGNAAGIRTVLVKPLVATDGWNTSINRFLEQFIFMKLRYQNGPLIWHQKLTDR